jgi:hypothetical protein
MKQNKQVKQAITANSLVIDLISKEEDNLGDLAEELVKDYEKLNEKCDTVITKIKSRKEKSKPKRKNV